MSCREQTYIFHMLIIYLASSVIESNVEMNGEIELIWIHDWKNIIGKMFLCKPNNGKIESEKYLTVLVEEYKFDQSTTRISLIRLN